eukprot:TRINITY_DN9284_c0_g2_i1.p1 TRINITY_DN9284_c0_g2~~TRINITY_DN9284_c0_g2_i1.p1  ORF type:complete len:678 (+),score=137.52 TRINITY_DN9284_c0_g2_i1:78-2111(+)
MSVSDPDKEKEVSNLESELEKLLGIQNGTGDSVVCSISDTTTLQQKLKESEIAREKQRNNLQRLKSKIMDTNQLIGLYSKAKENLAQTTQQLDFYKKEAETYKSQFDNTLREVTLLRTQLEAATSRTKKSEDEAKLRESQLQAATALTNQLKAELRTKGVSKEDHEKLQKEFARVKKESDSKESAFKDLKREHTNFRAEYDTLRKQSETSKKSLVDATAEISSLQSEIARLKEMHKASQSQRSMSSEMESDISYEPPEPHIPEPIDIERVAPKTPENKRAARSKEPTTSPKKRRPKKYEKSTKKMRKSALDVAVVTLREDPIRKQNETHLDYISRKLTEMNEGSATYDTTVACLSDKYVPDHNILRNGVLTFLKSDETSTIDEELMVCLIWQLGRRQTTIFSYIHKYLSDAVLRTSLPSERLKILSRILVQLSKIRGELELARVFLYDILIEKGLDGEIFVAIASVWPETLNCKETSSLIARTIQTLIDEHFRTNPASSSYLSLKSLASWNAFDSMDALLDELIKALQSADVSTFDLFRSFELVGAFKGWPWIHNQLIILRLWPVIGSALADHEKSNILANIIRLIGCLAQASERSEAEDSEGILALRTKIEGFLEHHQKYNFSWVVQISAAESLVDLSFGKVEYLTQFIKWSEQIERTKALPRSLERALVFCKANT